MEYGAKEPGMNVCVPGIAMLVHISGLWGSRFSLD